MHFDCYPVNMSNSCGRWREQETAMFWMHCFLDKELTCEGINANNDFPSAPLYIEGAGFNLQNFGWSPQNSLQSFASITRELNNFFGSSWMIANHNSISLALFESHLLNVEIKFSTIHVGFKERKTYLKEKLKNCLNFLPNSTELYVWPVTTASF